MAEPSDDRAHLVERMQAITSTDLVGAALNASIAQARLAAASRGCINCTNQDACRLWVEAHEGGRLAAPDFCDNRHLMGPSAAHF